MCTLNASYTYSSWYWTFGLRFRVLIALGFPWFCTEEDDDDDERQRENTQNRKSLCMDYEVFVAKKTFISVS
jgi:hypothetical protein